MKKALILICVLTAGIPALAGGSFKEHFDLGQQYLTDYRYSGAITEFKSALRINYLDNSARIGLVNSYLARGMYYANTDKDYQKAADDYRSALFYLVYYPNANQVRNSSQAIVNVTANLNKCLNEINFDTSSKNRYETAKQLRAEGNFSASAYEFNQALGDTSLIKDCFQQTGDIMKLLGNNQKSADYYKKAVSVAPNDIELRLSYAKMLDKLEQEDQAVQEYNYILTKTDDNKEVLYSLERIYKRKLEESPNDASVTANLGAIMQKLGNYDEALRYYAKAEYLDPSNINTRINVGTLYQQKGDYKTAITAYDSILIIDPDNVQANIYKAQSLAKLGDNKGAQDIYKKLLAKDPNNEQVQTEMISMVKDSMSVTQFVEYVKKNAPSNASDILYNYALDLHKQNKLADAQTVYNEVINLEPDNSEVYVNLALAQSQNKNYEGALATLKNAETKFPNNSQITDTIKSINAQSTDAKLEIAGNYFNNKDYQNAINEYLSITPRTADTMLGVASAYQNLGNNDKAIEYYLEAFNLAPTNSDIAYYISALYAEKEDFSNANLYVQKSLTLNKNNKQAQELNKMLAESQNAQILTNAISLFDAEQYDKSLVELNKLLASDSKNAYGYYYRAMISDAKQKYKEALTDYKKAVSIDPELVIVNYLIGIDYDMLEDYKNASSYYKSFIAVYSEDDDYKKYAENRIGELAPYVK
jgi:tetratricopeptide (TPR) repeat protein